jgi:hypothetical protein
MEILIQDKYLDVNKIQFKNGKHNTKILYQLNSVCLIGICLQLKEPFEYNVNYPERIEIKNTEQLKLFQMIDSYFNENIDKYVSFLKNNTIFVKNNRNPNKGMYVNINNIKYIHGKNYVNIFGL